MFQKTAEVEAVSERRSRAGLQLARSLTSACSPLPSHVGTNGSSGSAAETSKDI